MFNSRSLLFILIVAVFLPACADLTRHGMIYPGKGVGPITLGMANGDAELYTGTSQGNWASFGFVAWYPKAGISVSGPRQGPQADRINLITCHCDSEKGWSAFVGHTPEGITIGSSRDAVIQAYGDPDAAPHNSGVFSVDALGYGARGITFRLHKNVVDRIFIFAPHSIPDKDESAARAAQGWPPSQWGFGFPTTAPADVKQTEPATQPSKRPA